MDVQTLPSLETSRDMLVLVSGERIPTSGMFNELMTSIGRHSQSPSQGDFARSPPRSGLDRLEGTACCETTGLGERNSERNVGSKDEMGDGFVTAKRVFLQLWSDGLHCDETVSGGDWESLKLSGQLSGECGLSLAFDSSFTTSSL